MRSVTVLWHSTFFKLEAAGETHICPVFKVLLGFIIITLNL